MAERIDRLLQEKREEILRIAHQRGAYNVRVFGSVARGEAGPGSDVDLLIDYRPGYNLFDHSGLKQDLEKLLGREVDLVTEGCLREHIRSQVLKQAVPL